MTDDLSEEMRQHLDEKIEALVEQGMPRDEAIHAARRAFGNAALIEQRSRDIWIKRCAKLTISINRKDRSRPEAGQLQ
jgi:hypothetical protein